MKAAAHAYSDIETSAVEDSADFRIKVSDKAFRLLIDGLYSHKIRSIVRELTANAYDSHVRARCAREAFQVHIPTGLQSEFAVRDFGVGMDHEKVMGVYSTLFASDKDRDNVEVGQFGLGSKSPFSYTDTFAVTCYDGAVARHYTASIGSGGIPKIMLMLTEQTDTPRGVRVSFRVEEKDIPEFTREINAMSLAFDPVFRTNVPLTSKLGKPLLRGKGWTSHNNDLLPKRWNVQQGCVIYPLTESEGLQLPPDATRQYLINVPIGTVDVTVSREDVAYTPVVTEYLARRIQEVVDESRGRIAQEVSGIENVYEYFQTLYRVRPQFLSEATFPHPITGLTKPEVLVPQGSEIICAEWVTKRGGSWDYNRLNKLSASPVAKDGETHTVYRVSGLDEIRTVSEPGSALHLNEHRGLCMRIRNFLESRGLAEGKFWFDIPFAPDFIKCFSPNAAFVDLTMKELRTIKRPKKVKPQIIKGVSFVSLKSLVQEPAKEITHSSKSAWIEAETYRRYPKPLHALCDLFGVQDLYVVSVAGLDTINATTVPYFKAFAEGVLQKKLSLSWEDWRNLSHLYGASLCGGAASLYGFIDRLRKSAPNSLKKLLSQHGFLGTISRRMYEVPEIEKWHFDWKVQEVITYISQNGSTVEKLKPIKARKLKELAKSVTEFGKLPYYHPCQQMVSALSGAKSPEQLEAVTNALIAVFRAVPVTMKFQR